MLFEENLPPFSIIMVNYKTFDLTKNALERIQTFIDTKRNPVWVVDNQSGDESTEYLKSLDWIHLIERVPDVKESGYKAHGLALDAALHQIDTDYVFLFHTDTFLYDPFILEDMLASMISNPKIAAVGCLEQVKRPILRTLWRFFIRFFKHYFRTIKLRLGIKSRQPRGLYEKYIKSFCSLWDAKLLKSMQLHFMMDDRNPTYQTQDMLLAKGYKIETISPHKLFKFLDHVQAGTKSFLKGFGHKHRCVQRQLMLLKKNQHITLYH